MPQRKTRLRKKSRTPINNRKSVHRKRIRRRPQKVLSYYYQIMEHVIETIGTQILDLEIKLAVQQYLINESIDEWQRKGWLTEREVKSLYERTYQYWSNALKGQGNPFAELDLSKIPALTMYKGKLKAISQADQPSPSKLLFDSADIDPHREQNAELIHQMKEDLKTMKHAFLKQKLEEMKRSLNKNTV